MPAIHRYRSDRIREAAAMARDAQVSFLILSGLHGLLVPEQPIAWYDQKLVDERVAILIGLVAGQLKAHAATKVTFLACNPALYPEWQPYYVVLKQACRQAEVAFKMEISFTDGV